jgi:hypothetical protein
MDWSLLALKLLFTGIVSVILFVVFLPLLIGIRRTLAVKHSREHIIKISNQGNFTSTFKLSVVDVETMFDFKILFDDIPLVPVLQIEEPQPNLDTQIADQPSSPLQKNQPVQNKAASADKKSGAMGNFSKGGRAVAAKSGQAASFLGTLASLLPGSMGSGLRAQSEGLRQTQSKAQAAAMAPENTKHKVEALQQQSGRMVSNTSSASVGNPPSVRQLGSAHPKPVSEPVNSPPVRPNLAAGKRTLPTSIYAVQTQPVEPGDTLSLTLQVEVPKRSRPSGSYAYTLTSQQIPVEALNTEQPPITRQGVLYFPPVEFWRYWLPPVASFLVIAIFAFVLIFIFRFIWY